MSGGLVDVREDDGVGKVLVSRGVRRGQVVGGWGSAESDRVVEEATMHTVQLGEGRHVESSHPERFTAHSRRTPNCVLVAVRKEFAGAKFLDLDTFLDPEHRVSMEETQALLLVATKDVEEDEILSFNYETSEWRLSSPFTDVFTGEEVRGFALLPRAEQDRLVAANLVTPFILHKYKTEIAPESS